MAINEQYLSGEYARKNATFHIEDADWKAEQVLKAIERNRVSACKIAEVGCGAGEILVQLSRRMPDSRFFGYELSPQGFELCRRRESERVKYFQEDITTCGGFFDLVLCMDVFEHVEDYMGFLRKLAPTGRQFMFHIPLDMNTQMVLRASPLLRVREQVGHLHYFSKDTALATLRDCGYTIEDWFYTNSGLARPKSWKSRLLLFPRKVAQLVSLELTARVLGGYSLMVLAKPGA